MVHEVLNTKQIKLGIFGSCIRFIFIIIIIIIVFQNINAQSEIDLESAR